MRNETPPVDIEYVRLRCEATECGCWEWDGYMKGGRQPVAVFRRAQVDGSIRPEAWPIRPLVMLLTTGKHPNGRTHVVMPKCKNELCVRPDHMKVVRRGSYNKGQKKPATHGIAISRTRGKTSKVPDAAIPKFREHDADLRALAAEHQITLAYAYMLKNGQYRKAAAPNPFGRL